MVTAISDKDLSVTVDGHVELIECDEKRIDQVIENLLSNAVKYSPSGGSIHLHVGEASIGHKRGSDVLFPGGSIVFSVSDQGVGVPEGEVLAVFDRFIQSSKTNAGSGGWGLGLAICKEIIEFHHGVIWVEGVQNGGRGSLLSCLMNNDTSYQYLV